MELSIGEKSEILVKLDGSNLPSTYGGNLASLFIRFQTRAFIPELESRCLRKGAKQLVEGQVTSTSPKYLGPKARYLARARYLDPRRDNLERASYLGGGRDISLRAR